MPGPIAFRDVTKEAGLYEPLWAEHSPWSVFLRMLLARYGDHLDEEEPAQTRFELTRFQVDGVRRMQRLLAELGGVLVAALLPFGPFVIDGRLRKEDEALQANYR